MTGFRRVLVTVGGRKTNAAMGRAREHLDPNEVKRLIKPAKRNRKGARDGLMIYMAKRHGYRANELVELKHNVLAPWVQLFKDAPESPYVFVSERGAPITRAGFQRLVECAGVTAGSIFRCTRTCSGMPVLPAGERRPKSLRDSTLPGPHEPGHDAEVLRSCREPVQRLVIPT